MDVKLGKQAHKYDARTLALSKFVLPDIHVPQKYDFDHDKRPIPVETWGNTEWGNCVICGEANHILRMERVEQRRTVPLTEEIVVDRYKSLSGAKKPGDENDGGLVVLDAMHDWRHNGWVVNKRNYTIAAYGELDPAYPEQLRMACYVLHGIHFGFWLPIATQQMGKTWDYNGESGTDWQPGSWGGHLVYSKAFDENGFQVLSWGEEFHVTNNFIGKYCDEAWGVVDSFDSWRTRQTIDIAALIAKLRQISSKPVVT